MFPKLWAVTDRDHWLSRTIRFATRPRFSLKSRGKTSHAFVQIDEKNVLDQVLKCKVRPFADYVRPDVGMVGFSFVGMSAAEGRRVIRELRRSFEGKPYGIGQMLGFLLVEPLRRAGVSVDNPGTRNNVCSELAYECIYVASGALGRDIRKAYPDQDKFRPDDMVDFCLRRPVLFRIEPPVPGSAGVPLAGQIYPAVLRSCSMCGHEYHGTPICPACGSRHTGIEEEYDAEP